MNKQHEDLWNKIEAFPLDDSQAVFPFSKKLAQQNNWTQIFAAKAILEYKKFLLLCCISPRGASPSPIIDTVWHLHLTYTYSYWKELCEQTLGQPLHHHPSKGGVSENDKHADWYSFTLDLYYQTFEEYPPIDVWQAFIEPAENLPPDISYKIVKPQVFRTAVFVAFIFLTVIFIRFGHFNPYALNGPRFLEFQLYLSIAAIVIVAFVGNAWKKEMEAIVNQLHPVEYTIYEATHFLYSKHRALQTAIVDLLDKQVLRFKDNLFVYCGNNDYNSANPLLDKLQQLPEGEGFSYETISNSVYVETNFTNEKFGMLAAMRTQKNWWLCIPYCLVAIILAFRLLQGIANQKPIAFLLLGGFLFTIVYGIIISNKAIYSIIHQIALQKFQNRFSNVGTSTEGNKLLPVFALEGSKAMDGFENSASLASIFILYPVLGSSGNYVNANSTGGDAGGSSCGSDGGGSSCGGGGCGGCGGGD